MSKPVTVIFACTVTGKHDASLEDCTEKKSKTFSSFEKATSFITTCTHVFNLDEVLGAVPAKLIPEVSLEVDVLESHDISALVV